MPQIDSIKSMNRFIGTICTFASLGVAANGIVAQERVLDDDAWRADITAVADAIHEFHPRPFRTSSAQELQQRYQALLNDVPELSDTEVVLRLAALVALIDDGHTRLAIPPQHPEIGLEFGHTPTPAPSNALLEFPQLPLKFEKFEDGIFVVAARTGLSELIGCRLVAINDTRADDALAAVQAITYAENSRLEALMGADRLTLPDALTSLGVGVASDTTTLTLASPDGARFRRLIAPMKAGTFDWSDAFADEPVQLRHEHPDKKFWSKYVDDGHFVYLQMDEITDDDQSMAEFVSTTLREAIQRDARLVIDIRNNFGGSGGLNKTLVMSIIQSDELNQYDRTFVLTGRRTFSAAQMLVNELEQYTRVTFVGEPTGSRPDHYGDSKKSVSATVA